MTSVEELELEFEPILSTPHAEQSRKEGAWQSGSSERALKFTWAGVVVITNNILLEIITNWNIAGFGWELEKVKILQEIKQGHEEAVKRLKDKS